MTYISQLEERVAESRQVLTAAYNSAPPNLKSHFKALLKDLDEYEIEYGRYARDADNFDLDHDEIQISVVSVSLLKRADVVGKTELYFNSSCTDGTDEGQHYVQDKYDQLRKDETRIYPAPIVIYQGRPVDRIDYIVDCFDTKTDNHDRLVEAASDIVDTVEPLLVSSTGQFGVVAKAVTDIAEIGLQTALKHGDDFIARFQGSLTANVRFNEEGPYNIALPEIGHSSDKMEIELFIARVAKDADQGIEEGGRQWPQIVDKGLVLPSNLNRPRLPITAVPTHRTSVTPVAPSGSDQGSRQRRQSPARQRRLGA